MADNVMVAIQRDNVVVSGPSAVDGKMFEENIPLSELHQIVLERGEPVGGQASLHWFLKHRDGWTLHFNDQFDGASSVISSLETFGGFKAPNREAVAGPGSEGTVVWSAL